MQLTMSPTPRFPAANSAQLAALPAGEAGTARTLDLMVDVTHQAMRDPRIRALAMAITNGVKGKNYTGEVAAVQRWVKDHIRYVRDVYNVETISTPQVTIQQGAGDCDDQSIVVASLLGSIGHACRFRAIGYTRDQLLHVYTKTLIGPNWVAVETTEPWPLGKEPSAAQYPAYIERNI